MDRTECNIANMGRNIQKFECILKKGRWLHVIILSHESPALFQKIFEFCTFLPIFSNVLPFLAFFNIFYPFLPFFWKITHMPLLSRIDPGFLVMTICAYCYFGIFGVKCLTPAKIISYGNQHFWLQSFALVLQFGMQHLKGFSTIWIWWKLLLETDYQITVETPFYKFTSVEYQCKPSIDVYIDKCIH